ncbi:hypothetical protein CEP54_002029 [Fusarium duplospermum]|uniref:Fungal N-terminal domain-containing protein n=1 Tax=Fusarium duplospermum TaxID=1325734 RepID=A0A428QXK6_9HYPO|nr:hypothetical protein CEP54_002029 [Fusarium duplospermum]
MPPAWFTRPLKIFLQSLISSPSFLSASTFVSNTNYVASLVSMEILGAVASSVALGQAIGAGRHIVRLVHEIPEIQHEFQELKQDISLITAMLDDVQNGIGTWGSGPTSSTTGEMLLGRTAQRLEEINNELQRFVEHCAKESTDNTVKAKKRKWIMQSDKLQKLREKAMDAKMNLHFALSSQSRNLVCEHLSLSGIDLNHVNIYGDTPWDVFQLAIFAPLRYLGSWRRPSIYEQQAFVSLYEGIRNRTAEKDINYLEQVLHALSHQDTTTAFSLLQTLVEEKQKWTSGLDKWYRILARQVQEGELDAVIGSIEDYIEELRELIQSSAWDLPSRFTPRRELAEVQGLESDYESPGEDVDSDGDSDEGEYETAEGEVSSDSGSDEEDEDPQP